MQPLTKTFEQQSKLAFFCRTGKYETLENVNENNVYHYRRLVFNVVEDMLQSAYPLASELLTKEEWINVTKDFFANHPCVSPQVWSMPKEFYEYLFAIEHHPLMTKYPFLQELLWFEWLEVEMYMMEDKSPEKYSAEGNIENGLLVLNPEIHLQHFQYPVHLKSAKEISGNDKGNYFLSLHRHPEDGEVMFASLAPALLRAVELLNERPMTAGRLAETICHEMNIPHTHQEDEMLSLFIKSSLETKLILGFR